MRCKLTALQTKREAGVYSAMDPWSEIRRRVLTKELSKRQACEKYQIHWKTLVKMLRHAEPPGYWRQQPRPKPTLDPYLGHIQAMLEADRRNISRIV